MNIALNLVLLISLATGFVIPETIPVVLTGERNCKINPPSGVYPIINVDFKEYVKGVLPNEWYPIWNEESLKAGAVVVKMFALSMVERRGYVYDCNWSQVYNPSRRTTETDKAVDDTWDYVLLRQDKLFTTYYDDYLSTCYFRGEYNSCMGQWNSLSDAENGMNYKEILYKYYKNSSLISLTITKLSENTIVKAENITTGVEPNVINPEIMKDYLYIKRITSYSE